MSRPLLTVSEIHTYYGDSYVLQGVSRHSEEGVMKARWQQSDYQQMRTGLPFDPTDVELIRERLTSVSARSTRTAQ